MKLKRLSAKDKAVIFLCLLAACALFGVAALLDSQREQNTRYIIDNGKKVFCEELYYGVTDDGTAFQICLPLQKGSLRESVVLLGGKRTNTIDGGRLPDEGITYVITEAGTFNFLTPTENSNLQAFFNGKPLLEWRKK